MINRTFSLLNVLVINTLTELILLQKYSPQHTYKYFNIILFAHRDEELLKIGQINIFTLFLGKRMYFRYDMAILYQELLVLYI